VKKSEVVNTNIDEITNTWPYCLLNIQSRKLGPRLWECLSLHTPMWKICHDVYQERRKVRYKFEIIYEVSKLFMYYVACKDSVLERPPVDCLRLMSDLKGRIVHTGDPYSSECMDFVSFVLIDIMCNLILKLVHRSHTFTNKTALRYRRLGLPFIKTCIEHCSSNTILLLAGYFTMVKKHSLSLKILENVERKFNIDPAIYSCTHESCVNYMGSVHLSTVYDNKPSLKEFCKYYQVEPVTYRQADISHVPEGLVYEIFRTTAVSRPRMDSRLEEDFAWHHEAVIHNRTYLLFLRFLCFNAGRRRSQQRNFVMEMARTTKKLAIYPGTHRETNHNIIGHCHRTLGNTQCAYQEFRKSLSIEKYYNAVVWHLALLVQQKVRNDG